MRDAMDVLDTWLGQYNGLTRPAIPLGSKGEAGGAQLRLKYLDQDIVLDVTRSSITLGRDKLADVTIVDRMGSRLHGKIEYRLGKFVLGDHSANGTFVTFENEPEIVLRREEVVLRNKGSIAFGQSRETASEVAEFSCE